MMAYELELNHRIYSGDCFYYEIAPDSDGIGNIEIRYFDDVEDKSPKQVIVLTEDSIILVIHALETQLAQLRKKK